MPEHLKRPAGGGDATSARVRQDVSEMLLRIERGGEPVVREYSRKLDDWSPPSFVVEPSPAGAGALTEELRSHIDFALRQVRGFARAQRSTLADLRVEPLPGVVLGHRHVPVDAVGAYVPGGRYPMLASSFMTIAVAKEAGVRHVIGCAPPRAGQGVDPVMLHAMCASGADQVLCLGGVQGLAALAFGLCGVEPVDMLVGAGNAYVAEAKRQLFGRVGIDLLAGPTEVLVIAGDGADPELVAADLLGQAEHGPTSPAVLVTTSRRLGQAALAAVERLLGSWPTAAVAGPAWRDHGEVLLVADREEAVAVVGRAGARAPRGARRRSRVVARPAEQLRLALPGRLDRRLRRQGGRHQPRAPDGARRALHRRPLGRQVPEDAHLPGADAGGHARRGAGGRGDLARRGLRRARHHRRDAARARRGRDVTALPDGTVALVTGATGGIGSACARALRGAGATVVLVGRSAPAVARLAADLGAIAAPPCDLSDPAQVGEVFGELPVADVVVGCCGGNRPAPFLEMTGEDLGWALSTNVVAALLPAQAAARRMVAAGRGGAIVTVTSQMGHVGGRDRTAYCAAKHAVEGAHKAMALELAPHGIRVNTVAPTFVETAMTRSWLADAGFREAVLAKIPLGRLGTPDEVASAVVFAASPEARLMTGSSLLVDGGWTAQ